MTCPVYSINHTLWESWSFTDWERELRGYIAAIGSATHYDWIFVMGLRCEFTYRVIESPNSQLSPTHEFFYVLTQVLYALTEYSH